MANKTISEKGKYGLFTVVMMIVGIVVGSGIYFKSSTILIATNGNIAIGIVVFCIAAISIIFGSLTIAQLASRTEEAGGVISYATNEINSYAGCAIGWYHTFLFYTSCVGILGWISSIYMEEVFYWHFSLEQRFLAAILFIAFFFGLNLFASKIGAYFQTSAAIIKLIPLIIIGILGYIFGDFNNFISTSTSVVTQSNGSYFGWISAIAPVAFAFEGWIVATTLTHKIKNPKKNLPLALMFAPLGILLVYVFYFVGVSLYVGPDDIMTMKDTYVQYAATNLFGPSAGKLVVVCVLIAVLGTLNGNIMGSIQMPYSLALREMLPFSKKISKVNKTFDTPINSGIIAFITSIILLCFIYFDKKYTILGNSDLAEIIIVINYLLYIMLYIKVINLTNKKEIKGIFKGYVSPVMAIIGSCIMVYGGLQNQMFIYVSLLCLAVILISIIFWNIKSKKLSNR